ncbi:unnamed protein product, partial [Staurois parvus]
SLLIGLPLHRLSPLQSQLFSVCYPSLLIPPLTSTQFPPPLSASPSTGFHSVSSTPLCQSLHWLPFSVLHPSLLIPPLTSTVSSTPLCQSLHWLPLRVLHPPLPIPPLSVLHPSANPSTQCPPPL